jgi:hypothetical protein
VTETLLPNRAKATTQTEPKVKKKKMKTTELKEREERRLDDYSCRLHYDIQEIQQRAKLYKGEENSLDYVSDDIEELLEVYFSTTFVDDSLTLRQEIVEQKRLIRRLEKLIKADALISQALS